VYDCICAIVEKLFREFLLVVAEQPKSAKVREREQNTSKILFL
jgi:hypothetical protein